MANEHDKAILNCIFNPFLPVGECIYDEDLPDLKDIVEETPNIKEAKTLELEGVKAAESGNLDEAIEIFTRAIITAPKWASGFNNRAQAYRLKGNTAAALTDLNTAILLSGGEGRSGCQALCQRGIVYRKDGENELAKIDFEVATKLGSSFAKTQLIELNPYAALCNQMLHDVMGKLQNTPHNS